MTTALVILAAGIAVWFIHDSLRAREQVLTHCRRICTELRLQLLDETVSVSGLRPARDSHGRWHLQRVYRFEFSVHGADRHPGMAVMLGNSVLHVRVEHPDGAVILPAPERGAERLH